MQHKFQGSHRVLGAVVFGAASAVHAQQPATTAAPVVVVPQVVVTGSANSYDPRRDDTAAKIIVNSDELVKYGDASVVDALKRVAGVTVTSTGRGSDIRMRGLGGGYTQILVNGERAPFGFSIDSLSPGQVERIEVIRSATAEFSTESIAGTINIVLKKVAKRAQRQIQLGYGGDATERTARTVFLLSDRDGRFSYSLSANTRSTTFDRDGLINEAGTDGPGKTSLARTTNSHERGRFDIANIVPRLNWTLSNGDTLSSETMYSYTRFRFDAAQMTTSALGGAPQFPVLDLRTRTHNDFLKSDLVWSSRLSPDSKLELKVGAQGANASNDSSRDGFSGTTPLLHNRIGVAIADKGLSSSGKLSSRMGDQHQVTMGFETSRTLRDETDDEFNFVAGNGAPTDVRTSFSGKVIRSAAFAQDEWTVTPNWSVYFGLRWEAIATESLTSQPVKSNANVWSPIAQTLIKFPDLPNDQLRLAVTRTFKAPELGSLLPRRSRNEINSSTNPDAEGNPGLKPELARGVDATYEHFFAKSALISVGLSSREIDNYTLTEVTLDTDGRWVGRPVNAGSASVRGLELESKFPLSLLMASSPAVEVRASLGRNWSSVERVPGPGNRVAQQIPLSASLSLDYTRGALTTGGSFVFRKGAWTRMTAAQSAGSWNRRYLDIYGLWKLNAKQQLRVTMGNLLAQDNIVANEYREAAGSTTRTTVAPGFASVRALFEQKF